MATGNLSAQLRKTMKNSMRKRGTEISEKKVDCSFAGCEEKSKTFRVIAKHFKDTHSTSSVLGFRCDFPSCKWFCMKSLKCFTEHMKIHNVIADKDTEITLVTVRKSRHTDHTAICNTMKAETIAVNLAKKEEEKVVRKVAKIAKKISDDLLDEGVESILIQIKSAENVNTQQQENILTISTTELDISGSGSEYDPEDRTNYEEDDLEEQLDVSEENTSDNSQGYPDIRTMKKAFKKEFEEVDLTNSDDEEEEIVKSIPVEKVRTMKRKLSFTVSDNIVKRSKGFK
jgi:hypothetical protein